MSLPKPTEMGPRIAVLLDENTSGGATRYEAHKGYFQGLRDAGAAPFGLPYFAEMVPGVSEQPMCGRTRAGRPLVRSTYSGKSAGTDAARS